MNGFDREGSVDCLKERKIKGDSSQTGEMEVSLDRNNRQQALSVKICVEPFDTAKQFPAVTIWRNPGKRVVHSRDGVYGVCKTMAYHFIDMALPRLQTIHWHRH
jgi:hypothetical protein